MSNLCDIKSGLCDGHLNIPRIKMPQIPDDIMPDLLEHLEAYGYTLRATSIPVYQLKPTQNELNTNKVCDMVENYLAGDFPDITDTIIVSSDGYIIDGHHRWAACRLISPTIKMQTIQVELPIRKLLRVIRDYPGVRIDG